MVKLNSLKRSILWELIVSTKMRYAGKLSTQCEGFLRVEDKHFPEEEMKA